ncbi:MAG TPA: hypothetical protein VF037_03545 [Gemmatimonadales bacterium]
MIRVDLRSRLTGSDLELAIVLLARGSAARRALLERRLAAEGPDALLDSPELPERLLAVRSIVVPSERLFVYVMLRHALLQAGLDDRDLADYMAALVLDFGRKDRAWRVDWNDDARHTYLVDILADLEASNGERRFKVMAHLGNYAIWLAGLFPDYIAARRLRRGGPDLSYYDSLGRRGFGMASDHVLADHFGLEGVFRTTAERYPEIRGALNVMSERYFFPAA